MREECNQNIDKMAVEIQKLEEVSPLWYINSFWGCLAAVDSMV